MSTKTTVIREKLITLSQHLSTIEQAQLDALNSLADIGNDIVGITIDDGDVIGMYTDDSQVISMTPTKVRTKGVTNWTRQYLQEYKKATWTQLRHAAPTDYNSKSLMNTLMLLKRRKQVKTTGRRKSYVYHWVG